MCVCIETIDMSRNKTYNLKRIINISFTEISTLTDLLMSPIFLLIYFFPLSSVCNITSIMLFL